MYRKWDSCPRRWFKNVLLELKVQLSVSLLLDQTKWGPDPHRSLLLLGPSSRSPTFAAATETIDPDGWGMDPHLRSSSFPLSSPFVLPPTLCLYPLCSHGWGLFSRLTRCIPAAFVSSPHLLLVISPPLSDLTCWVNTLSPDQHFHWILLHWCIVGFSAVKHFFIYPSKNVTKEAC